jgi:hypothetical protein
MSVNRPNSAREVTAALNRKGFATSTTEGYNANSSVSGRSIGISTLRSTRYGAAGNQRFYIYVVTCHGVNVGEVLAACKELGYDAKEVGFQIKIRGKVAFTMNQTDKPTNRP